MMTHDEMIAVIAAHRDGKKIQCQSKDGRDNWFDTPDPAWYFAFCDYRIKPEPREWWVVTFGDGSCVGYPNKADAEGALCPVTLVREVLP